MILLSFLLFLSRFSLPLKLVFLATACGACGCYATAFVKTIGEIIANTAGHQGGRMASTGFWSSVDLLVCWCSFVAQIPRT